MLQAYINNLCANDHLCLLRRASPASLTRKISSSRQCQRSAAMLSSAKHDGQCAEKRQQKNQKHQLLLPAVLEKTDHFPHKCIWPEPPLRAASDSFRRKACQPCPDSAAEHVIIRGGIDHLPPGLDPAHDPARKLHVLICVCGLVLRPEWGERNKMKQSYSSWKALVQAWEKLNIRPWKGEQACMKLNLSP